MASTGLGITVGHHSLRAVAVQKKGETYAVTKVVVLPAEGGSAADAGRRLAAEGIKGGPATLGLSGKDVIIRYNQVPPVPDWRLRNLMKFEVLEVSGQSGGEVSADWRKMNLPDPEGTRGEETVLVCLARNAYLEPLMAGVEGAGIKVAGGCPNSVGLFTAFAVNATYREDETCLLVHVGSQGLDLAIQRGGELLFARNASPGGQAFTDAVAAAFSYGAEKAENLKLTKGDVTPRGQARYADSTAEKVANAMVGVAGQVSQLIQSTLMIGRAQTKLPDLKVDRVLLAGGGASLKGLDAYLKQSMGVPVERFNPFEGCDLSALSDEERALVEQRPHELATALGLAQTRLASAAFPLEVLPEGVRRKRDFATKGVFGVLAGVVSLAALGILYTSRQSAADEIRKQALQLKADEKRLAVQPDQDFKVHLTRLQEVREKHRRLAELATPGVLYADTLGLLERGLRAHPEVYLKRTTLEVLDGQRSYPILKPRGPGGGYQERIVTLPDRTAYVEVEGRVMPGASPEKVFNDFVSACKREGKAKGLEVSTTQTFKTVDGSFKLRVEPGVSFAQKASTEANAGTAVAAGWTLRHPVLVVPEGGGDPEAVRGIDVQGLEITVPKAEIDPDGWKVLLEKASPDTKPDATKSDPTKAGN